MLYQVKCVPSSISIELLSLCNQQRVPHCLGHELNQRSLFFNIIQQSLIFITLLQCQDCQDFNLMPSNVKKHSTYTRYLILKEKKTVH